MTSLSLFTVVLEFIYSFCNSFDFESNMFICKSWNSDGLVLSHCVITMNLLVLIYILYRWFNDIIVESTFEGHHTSKVQDNILLGMQLFIASEVMFFFSFFWAFFHFCLTPSIYTGNMWLPYGVCDLECWAMPFLNTTMLVCSGCTMNYAQSNLACKENQDLFVEPYTQRNLTLTNMALTMFLGVLFTMLQGYEYSTLHFTMSGNAFGSMFYMVTGFHGFHVMVGTMFLVVCYFSLENYHFSDKYHVGFMCAMWYWHFVDIVWIFLYIWVYVYGTSWGFSSDGLEMEFKKPLKYLALLFVLYMCSMYSFMFINDDDFNSWNMYIANDQVGDSNSPKPVQYYF